MFEESNESFELRLFKNYKVFGIEEQSIINSCTIELNSRNVAKK